ncbi:UDP-glycosyltransferase 92A1-like [Miscanthus floridulus]|uniref:UDP-glycosyltransferase 92A1-like n=1 Tax=Miscanthus floridulus TaxID=154761 RepID=UPI003458B472
MGPEQQERGSGHLLLFPFLVQGHLIPFLNLAKRLESLGQRGGSGQHRLAITIVSTPRNVVGLRRALPARSSIHFAELPFSPSDRGLPPDAESADDVPLHAFPTFSIATELLRPSFKKLLIELAGREGRGNVCVLTDMFLGWTAEITHALIRGVQPNRGFHAEWLPDDFEERVAAARQGMVVRGWARQVRILAHASTGAFLSHCGWNSVLESLWHGMPVVGWPLLGDQLFDSRVLVELGVGVEVASGRFFGGLGSKGWERVRDVVEMVLGDGDKAKDMRRKATEMKKLARAAVGAADGDSEGKGLSVLAMERLVDSAFD